MIDDEGPLVQLSTSTYERNTKISDQRMPKEVKIDEMFGEVVSIEGPD